MYRITKLGEIQYCFSISRKEYNSSMLSVSLLLNELTNMHENWHELYGTADNLNDVFLVSYNQ
jgi:hypothetical protein